MIPQHIDWKKLWDDHKLKIIFGFAVVGILILGFCSRADAKTVGVVGQGGIFMAQPVEQLREEERRCRARHGNCPTATFRFEVTEPQKFRNEVEPDCPRGVKVWRYGHPGC